MMFSLDEPRIEKFLESWLGDGEHQFGQYRNEKYENLAEYKFFITKCALDGEPCFHSIQPSLKITKLFYEFDIEEDVKDLHYNSPELDVVWMQALMLAGFIKKEGMKPIVFYSGCRGYHVWSYLGEMSFKEYDEKVARRTYKKLLFGLMGDVDLYPNLDRAPTHINALARLPFSFHQKTNNQVVPLTLDREPYIPDIEDFKMVPDSRGYIIKVLYESRSHKPRVRSRRSGDWGIRPCVLNAFKTGEHYARLAFLADAIMSGTEDLEIHDEMRRFQDYDEYRTQYQIDASRRRFEDGMLPPSCETLKLWKICDDSCKKNLNPWDR